MTNIIIFGKVTNILTDNFHMPDNTLEPVIES